MMMMTGSLMDVACLLFWLLRPPKPLELRFEEASLTFSLGWNFWVTLVVGEYLFGLSNDHIFY